jgi:hypothetical protein
MKQALRKKSDPKRRLFDILPKDFAGIFNIFVGRGFHCSSSGGVFTKKSLKKVEKVLKGE